MPRWRTSRRSTALAIRRSFGLQEPFWAKKSSQPTPSTTASCGAVRFRRDFRGEGSLEGWVWQTVVNAACRSRRRLPAPGAGAEAALDRGANHDARDVDGRVRELVALLPERQRLTVFLCYYADLDYDTIAEALDISPGTVAAALSVAHATLRQALEEVPG